MIKAHDIDFSRHKNLIDFSTNINPLGLPRGVKMAMIDSVDLTVHYPDTKCNILREKLAMHYGIKKDYIICKNGASDIIFSIAIALKPSKSFILAPTLPEYEKALRLIGSKIYCYQLKEELEFSVKEDILNFITKDIDMIFLCNPNIPTGEIIPKKLLMKIAKKCKENNIILVIDECYNCFLDNSKETSFIPEVEHFNNVIVINSFSHIYAMPGIRLGFATTSNLRIHEFIKKSTQPWSVSLLAQQAGIAALKEKDYIKRAKDLIKSERGSLIKEVSNLGYQVFGSKANFIFFKADKKLYEKCLNKGIIIGDCSNYKELEAGYYHIAIKTHEENIKLLKVLSESTDDYFNDR